MRQTIIAFALAFLAVASAPSAHTQTNPFVGQWRGTMPINGMPAVVNLVMTPDQRYSHQVQMGPYMTLQTGTYGVTGQNVISFNVVDWEPKTQPVYHPTGTAGGYYTQEPTGKPPGGSYRFQFDGPASLILQDAALGGTITLMRVQ